jgi:hypothetical protein
MGLITSNGLEIASWQPMASRTAIQKAYTLYQLVKAAAANPRLLRKVTELLCRRNTVETLLENVFLPLVIQDAEDCQRVGHLAYWVLAKKRGRRQEEPGRLGFVCPICRSAFEDSRYDCTVCGRKFPVINGAPVFLTLASEGE